MSVKVNKANLAELVREVKQDAKRLVKKDVKRINQEIKDVVDRWFDDFGRNWTPTYTPITDSRNFKGKNAAKIAGVFDRRQQIWQGIQVNYDIGDSPQVSPIALNVDWEIGITVLNNEGKTHNLWYWLDRGTQPFTQQATSPFLGPQYAGPIKAGKTRPALEARAWSYDIKDAVVAHFNRMKGTLEDDGWVIRFRIDDPEYSVYPETKAIR